MDFGTELGLFVLKALIIVVAILVVIGGIARAASRGPAKRDGQITVKKLNERYKKLSRALERAVLPASAARAQLKAAKKADKAERKLKGAALAAKTERGRVYVLDFDGNLRASGVDQLREEVTAVLGVAREVDEVVVRLKSPGGLVHAYGLAASQLERVAQRKVQLTVAVDLVAASGGYMMACVADTILAAPFAVVGSIGVVAQVPNVHRFLKKRDIDIELMTAGKYKRTLTVLGENTEEGRRKFQQDLEETHDLFKAFLATHRPAVDLEQVATGEHWYGSQAVALGLVDRVTTSDDYLLERRKDADLFAVAYKKRRSLMDRMGGSVARGVEGALGRLWERLTVERHS